LPLEDFKLESNLYEALGTSYLADFNSNYPELDIASIGHPFNMGLPDSPNQIISHRPEELQVSISHRL